MCMRVRNIPKVDMLHARIIISTLSSQMGEVNIRKLALQDSLSNVFSSERFCVFVCVCFNKNSKATSLRKMFIHTPGMKENIIVKVSVLHRLFYFPFLKWLEGIRAVFYICLSGAFCQLTGKHFFLHDLPVEVQVPFN